MIDDANDSPCWEEDNGCFLDALPLHLDKLSNRQNNMNSHQKNILASETRKKR